MSSPLFTAIADVIEKNLTQIILKPMESILGSKISKDLTQAFLQREQFSTHADATLQKNLKILSSTYGRTIPKIYGTTRVVGNIIWAKPIQYSQHQQVLHNSSQSSTKSKTTTSYNATLAIAICQGPIHEISKIWANEKPLNLATITYRLYKGTETQDPDPLILNTEDNAPAYRGIAYIVIENLPLQNYNNSIPSIVFEVTAYPEEFLQNHVSKQILAIHTVGPGEFTYDTKIQKRFNVETINSKEILYGTAKNINGEFDNTYSILGLNSLYNYCANVQWIAVTVHWFASHSDIQKCTLKPGTSLTTALKTIPDTWQVGSYNCSNAHALPLVNNHPKFEGTTSDISLLRYISELRSRKYKVLLLLKVVVLNGDDFKLHCEDAKHINKFFEQQYQPFVAHYYRLSKNAIDAFVIASGLSQLTKIQDENDKFPAVTSLKTIASHAKTFLGNSVIITYAADYDEYHSHNGVYNMDELWLSNAIDVIGINAYFPLLSPGLSFEKLSIEEIAKLWESGEGYSYFYDETDTDKKQPIAYTHPRSAWKNIQYWWESHIKSTAKTAGSTGKLIDKKIWFIEYGFRSVENCINRNTSLDFMNDIMDYTSSINIDYLSQKVAIEGTLKAWKSSNMVERMFLYGWDLRPQRNTDTNSFKRWQSSFFVNRKIMLITLSDIIQDVLQCSGIDQLTVKIKNIDKAIYGYSISKKLSAWDIIKELQSVYNFTIREESNQITLYSMPPENVITISKNDIEVENCTVTHTAANLHNTPVLSYISMRFDYQVRSQSYSTHKTTHNITDTVHTSLVLDDKQAEKIVLHTYDEIITKNTIYKMTLPLRYLHLKIGDIIEVKLEYLNDNIKIMEMRILSTHIHIMGYSCSVAPFNAGVFPI
ncbi:glycoside hydrolase/phage tail family protein [Anaplasma phagocytophilum]|uniref:GTA TIM-barrel-like domain protein n=2 Tax=Anaplasma phagocytophilum TaxID=948 RepID=S6GAZ7_ANAPH|nr:glycoside hydrolase TIM-barrel-like domain-containing protein [Anaplasma phagocytophilum]EOA62192.1 hypothetical protein CRT38_02962 [Anaplasma phagocytophilum str. CRT38]KDB57086.1 hypothetical protein P030_04440 [Anaplasma phagocytophilum str. CRT35]